LKLIESYSLAAGQKIDKIDIQEKFCPLPFEKYICFAPYSKGSKNYSYYLEVLKILFPILEKEGIKIVQLGAQGEAGFPFCYQLQGHLSWNQSFYLIGRSLLYFGADTAASHVAGARNIPLVTLVSNNFGSAVSPYFGDKNKQIILEPPCRKEGINPLFTLDEPQGFKQIDQIKIEDIVDSILKLLNLPNSYLYKTIQIGSYYNNGMVESVPDQLVDIKSLNIPSIVFRMDIKFNEDILSQQLGVGNVSIVTDKPIKLEILKQFKPRIQEINYFIDKTNDPLFIENLRDLGIRYNLGSWMSTEDIRNEKLKYMDLGIINPCVYIKPSLEGKNIKNIYYKSNRFLLSQGKIYQSYSAYKKGITLNKFEGEFQQIIDEEDFWKDIMHFMICSKE
jgi:hypothetical protein